MRKDLTAERVCEVLYIPLPAAIITPVGPGTETLA